MSHVTEGIAIIAVLVVGMVGGAFLTRWINWFTFGENQARKEMARKRAAKRAASRNGDAAGDKQ